MTQLGTKKSRHGCTHCKRRRVKCDERVPCSNCQRRGETCSLLYPASADRSSNGSTSPDGTDWLQDLELMHHWSRRTCHTQLGGGAHTHLVWGEFVPREAVKHRFLMHGLLAMAALHYAAESMSQATEEKYLSIHDKHHVIALESSRAIMANINADSAAALFAFSSITSLSALSASVIRAKREPEPRCISIEKMAGCMALTRGVREIVAASFTTLLKSPMSPLLTGYEVHCNVRVLLPKHLTEKINMLQRMLSEKCGEDKEKLGFCSMAVICLQQIYRNIFFFLEKDCLGVGHIWRWTAMVDTEFIQLLHIQYQPALVIAGFFLCTCQFMRAEWFMQDWGKLVMASISMALTDEYRPYLAWPKEQMATDCADFRQGNATIEYLDPDPNDNVEKAILQTLFPGVPPEHLASPSSSS